MVPDAMHGCVECLQQHFARYNAVLNRVHPKHAVLDVGCGTGYGTFFLSLLAKSVHGIDKSQEALEYASKNYGRDNITFLKHDIESDEGLKLKFDLIISFEVIEHLDPDKFFEFIRKSMKPTGVLIFSTPIVGKPTERPENYFHRFEWTTEQFMNEIVSRFRTYQIFEQYNRINFIQVQEPRSNTYGIAVCSNFKS